MSTLTPDRVYQGFWVDYSKGDVLGSTITVTSERAYVIVAFVSITIAFAGAHLWDIVAFVLFASHTTHAKRDGIHHQRQILLRNTSTPTGIIIKTLEIYLKRHHQGRNRRLFSRLSHITLIAILCSMGFLAAGILSANIITTTAIHVLAQTKSCGFVTGEDGTSYQESFAHQSLRYTMACYNKTTMDPGCQVFVTKTIPFSTTYTDCPFHPPLCKYGNEHVLELDTGHMWSDEVFGINSRKVDAISLRKSTICTPLATSDYWTRVNGTSSDPESGQPSYPLGGEQRVKWNYGAQTTTTTDDGDTTWSYSDIMTKREGNNFIRMAIWNPDSEGTQQFFPSPNHLTWSSWQPLDGFQHTRPDIGAITAILVRINGLGLASSHDDPLLPFTEKRVLPDIDPENGTKIELPWYFQPDDTGTLACTDRVQFCVSSGRCTTLTHAVSAGVQALDFGLSERANVTLYAFLNSLVNHRANMGGIYDVDYDFPMLAMDRNSRGSLSRLHREDSQYRMEVQNWQALTLVMLQKSMSDVAAGQGLTRPYFDIIEHWPAGPGEAFLCHAQKMMAPLGFSNIDVFGLAFIMSICGTIILLNVSLATALRYLPWNMQKQRTALEQWHEDDVLTLQRLAYESNGIGTWDGLPYRVPTTSEESFKRLADMLLVPTGSTEVYNDSEKARSKLPTKAESKLPENEAESSSDSDQLKFQRPFSRPFSRHFTDDKKTTSAALPDQDQEFTFDEDQYHTKFSRKVI